MNGSIRQLQAAPREPAPKVPNPHTTPSDAFRGNLRELRKRRGYRQSDLAALLGVGRTVISKIEDGTRDVSLDEAIAICASLGASPLSLLSRDNTPVEVAPGEVVGGFIYRAWIRGNAWVHPDGVDYMPAEVDIDGWHSRVATSIGEIIRRHQSLLDALEPFIDPDSEAAAAAGDYLEAARAEVEGFARAVAERNSVRPVRRNRVHKAA